MLATILVTDIVESTARASAMGDGAWREVLERHHALVRRELERFRGTEIDTAGDGFLATFDGPARAIRCAVAVRDGVRALGLEIRAGLHTGEVELAKDGVRGIAVHTAARVAGEAGPARSSSRARSGPRRRIRHRVPRSRRARAEGRPEQVAAVRGDGRVKVTRSPAASGRGSSFADWSAPSRRRT